MFSYPDRLSEAPAARYLKYHIVQPDRAAWKDQLYTEQPSPESDLAWSRLQTGNERHST